MMISLLAIGFTVVTLLTPLIHATPAINIQTRQTNLPSGWASIGCYSDITSSRTLKVASFTDINNMTIESCIAFCTPVGYKFAGVEFSRECYCDNLIESPGIPISSSTCDMPCTGNANEICGGAGGINIFQNLAISSTTSASPGTTSAPSPTTVAPSPTPTIKQTVGTFDYQGCFLDGVNGASRSLIHQLSVSGGVTAESCTSACKAAGFILAGLEFGQECWCDIYMPRAIPAPDTDCNKVCIAQPTELCGAGNRLAVYVDTTTPPLNTSFCLNFAQLQGGNVPEFNFDLEGRYVPAFPGAPVSVPGLLGNLPVPQASSPNGLHLQVLTGRTDTLPHTYSLPIETFGAPEALLAVDLQGNGIGFAIQPAPGGSQFFDVGQFDNVQTFFGYCGLPNPFSPSTYIGPPLLGVNEVSAVWGFCAGGLIYLPNATNAPCSSVVLAMTQPL